MRQDLLDEINNFASTLGKISKWNCTGDAFGHILQIKNNKGDVLQNQAKSDYFYEFYCYLKIIDDLNQNPDCKLQFIKGNGVFPRSPAKKRNRPYFKLYHKNMEIYHIITGTQIETHIPNKLKAPDISFQKPSADPDLPSYKDVDIIYDAKYSDGNKDKSFSESQMSDFNKMIRFIKTKKAHKYKLPYINFNLFKGNCLITNKKSYTNNLDELKKERITVVEYFDEGKYFNVIG